MSFPHLIRKMIERDPRYPSGRVTPSIAMATKSFERIVLSRARSAASGGQGPLTKQSFRNIRQPLRSTAFSDHGSIDKAFVLVIGSFLRNEGGKRPPSRRSARETARLFHR